MTNNMNLEEVTVIRRPNAKENTDGAALAVRWPSGEMLALWPTSSPTRYVEGNVAPCKISEQQLASLLEDLHLDKLLWKNVGDHLEATTLIPRGKISSVCGLSR